MPKKIRAIGIRKKNYSIRETAIKKRRYDYKKKGVQ